MCKLFALHGEVDGLNSITHIENEVLVNTTSINMALFIFGSLLDALTSAII